jgi:hypothetical protein
MGAIPKGVKRKIIGQISEMLKSLIRKSHESEILQVGEEDFGLVIFQEDKKNPESPLWAIVVAISDQGEVLRQIKSYNLDNLIGQAQNLIK